MRTNTRSRAGGRPCTSRSRGIRHTATRCESDTEENKNEILLAGVPEGARRRAFRERKQEITSYILHVADGSEQSTPRSTGHGENGGQDSCSRADFSPLPPPLSYTRDHIRIVTNEDGEGREVVA